MLVVDCVVVFVKQKTAYEMRISDWSSDVCSSDLLVGGAYRGVAVPADVPEDMRRQISEVFVNINKQPSFVEKMAEGGYVLVNVGYDEVPAFMEKLGKETVAIGTEIDLVQ